MNSLIENSVVGSCWQMFYQMTLCLLWSFILDWMSLCLTCRRECLCFCLFHCNVTGFPWQIIGRKWDEWQLNCALKCFWLLFYIGNILVTRLILCFALSHRIKEWVEQMQKELVTLADTATAGKSLTEVKFVKTEFKDSVLSVTDQQDIDTNSCLIFKSINSCISF